MKKNSAIYIAGHTGLLGSALVKVLKANGYSNILIKTHEELDLTNRLAVELFFNENTIEYIFLCAAKVGGIIGNKNSPASYLHVNLMIQDNIFSMSNKYRIKNIIFYGSSCTYPKMSQQPIKEEYLLSGSIEETSIGYATAKIAGMVGCKVNNIEYKTNRFICLVPNSMYGPNDNFDLENSHVLSALIRKIDTAKDENLESLTLWGSGMPRREFIFSEDVAHASIFLMKNADKLENSHYNLGTGMDYSIQELTEIISKIVGYNGKILWDSSKPDGTMQKLLDSSRFLAFGWNPTMAFEDGLRLTYEWYLKNKKDSCEIS
jgi:GDP-L-fucose synthase